MWDLVQAKNFNIYSVARLDVSLSEKINLLQKVASEKRRIDEVFSEDKRQEHYDNVRIQKDERLEDWGFSFYHPWNEKIELKSGGVDIDVTIHNVQDYIELVINAI